MKILLVHNRYRTGAPGGEDIVFEQERTLLEQSGHEVSCYLRSNDEMDEKQLSHRARVVIDMQRSERTVRELGDIVRRNRPDVAHFHNVFPLISASGYEVCANEGIPVVQTIHNHRISCSTATHFRNGSVCERCTPSNPWAAVRYGCYRNSHVASLAVASMIFRNHLSQVHQQSISKFIALTRFSANRLVSAGIAPERIVVKPNFVDIPDVDRGPARRERAFAFVGRLAEEKGLRLLFDAWKQLRDVPLWVVGEGPLRAELEKIAADNNLPVRFLGLLERTALPPVLSAVRSIIVPSLCLEGGVPLTLLEAMASGTPAIASRLGGIPEIIDNEVDGLLFEPGNSAQLVQAVRRLEYESPFHAAMSARAVEKIIRECDRQANLKALIDIYDSVVRAR